MGEADKAKELLHERIGSYHSTAAGYCRNLVVDSILSANKSVASANDIEYLIDVILEEDLGIDRIDLCGVFGNILDNAVTACKEVASGRLIMLSAAVKGGCLVIRCKNTKANEIKFSKGKPLSTKGPDHGLGLTILEDIAKKYDGSFNIVCDDQYFQITVFLMCGAVNSAPLKLS
jgi:sensor histidine kinase regulating citrate/malate metabolism